MDNKTIETLSVNAVRDSIVMCDILDQFIADNDKEPSWDGFVYIYEDKKKTKDKLRGRIPVQVKGTVKGDLTKGEITFPVSTVDLNNYLSDGGVIFFVVYIGKNGQAKQIYYDALPPIKLRAYLRQAQQQKSKKIKLKKFPTSSHEKARIFLQCLTNCQKQASFSSAKLPSLEELQNQGILEGITVPIMTAGGLDPKTALFKGDTYIYARVKGNAILQPLEIIPEKLITREERSARIAIGERVFYSKVTITQDAEKIVATLGESLTFTVKDNDGNVKIEYKDSVQIRTLAVDLEFMLSYIEEGSFWWNEVEVLFNEDEADFSNFSLEEQKERLRYMKKIVRLLDLLGCSKDINVKKLTERDWKNLSYLVTSLIDKDTISNLKEDLPPLLSMNVGDLKFIVQMQKVENKPGTYRILDFFKNDIPVGYETDTGKYISISQYDILSADDLLSADNLQFDVLLPSFQKIGQDNETIIRANLFLLELLRAYDKDSSKFELLDTAKKFSNWIFESTEDILPYDMKLINRLQVERRLRPLNTEEVKELYRIVETPGTEEDILVGAYLLLEQQISAEVHFARLEKQSQEQFKKYPIFHFWKGNGENDNGKIENADGE